MILILLVTLFFEYSAKDVLQHHFGVYEKRQIIIPQRYFIDRESYLKLTEDDSTDQISGFRILDKNTGYSDGIKQCIIIDELRLKNRRYVLKYRIEYHEYDSENSSPGYPAFITKYKSVEAKGWIK